MSKGGSPMGGGGFGGQQQGFGGGFGGPQGGFGGGFGGQQGGFGGGFNQMPQQQRGGFGGGFNQMPQQQQGGFGGGFGMPQQQQGGFGGFGGRYQPSRQRFNQMPQQQMGYGGGFGGQMQGFGMPQQQGFGGGFGMPQQGFGGGYGMPQQRQQDMFTPQVNRMPPQDFSQSQAASQAAGRPAMLGYSPEEMQRSLAAPSQSAMDDYLNAERAHWEAAAESGKRNAAARAAQANQPPVSMEALVSGLRGIGGALGGGSQSVVAQPGGNLVGGGQQVPMEQMQQYQQLMQQAQMPSNPYAQQVRQEDPRMQAMRMMQRMRFGGGVGGGYNF